MTVRCRVRGDDARLALVVSGRLQLSDVASLRAQMFKCLTEQPEALLIDLSELHVDQPLALAVFTTVLRQAASWPGTPVLLCGPPPATRDLLLTGAYRQLPLFSGMAAARRHITDGRRTVPTVREELLPISGSTRHARDVVTDACLGWDLPGLVAPASLIVTEFVGNVIDHANTMMTLRISLRPRQLNLAVRDGSSVQPPPLRTPAPESTSGRGLLLVDALADSWGCLPSEGGKVMWAALRR
ncbi:ATP-binding protein [Actinoplanes aureus]|uniref:ATP-binding protein n=1 Tax=Actinoplanes aureus TaxID=2792083 RepID=A0A931CM73_9ACTN|nr:ATP-binding protein [Actinoplanes aureus]MBG0567490.1 ATP-binding protein [Actinoplanes aureus]